MPKVTPNRSYWTMDLSTQPPSFLPTVLDTSDFVDVTTLSDRYKVYLDAATGRIHRGEDYVKKAREEGLNV